MNIFKMCEILEDEGKIGEVMQINGSKFPYLVLLKTRSGVSPIQIDKGYAIFFFFFF